MQWTSDVSRGDWIRGRLHGWGHVGGVVPRGFEAYARILHPISAYRGDETARWRWAEVADRTGRVLHPLVQSQRLFGPEPAHLEFPDGWSPSLPEEGRLEPELLAHLTGQLRNHGREQAITLGIWDGWGEINGASSTFLLWAPAEGTPCGGAGTSTSAVRSSITGCSAGTGPRRRPASLRRSLGRCSARTATPARCCCTCWHCAVMRRRRWREPS